MSEHEQVEVSSAHGWTVVRLTGQFIGGTETEEVRSFLTVTAQQTGAKVVIDLEPVSYVNSSFIGVLLSVRSLFDKNGGKIVLAGGSPAVRQVLELTRLNMVFTIYENMESFRFTLGVV
jgi:anti-sigma B factor antagonist